MGISTGKKGDTPASESELAAAATRKTAEVILDWANVRLPRRPPDADEARDPIESDGFSVMIYEPSFDAPTKCLGFACPLKSHVCDRCKFFTGGTFSALPKPPSTQVPRRDYLQANQYDKYELYMAAPLARGTRAFLSLRSSKRVFS